MASVTENVRQLDSSKCRICMFAKPNLSPLFRRGLSMKVMKLAEIKMYEGDGLPSTICLDCEMEVNRCVNFIAQIQRADVKLREMLEKGKEFKDIFEREQEVGEQEVGEVDEQEASTSQIEIEEFNVKQEIYVDNFLDEVEDAHSESDHDHFGDGIENDEQAEDEIELNPLNHVDVVEDRKRAEGMDVSSDPLGQEEPIIESQNNESDPGLDPLNCMKQEAVSMDIDKDTHEASASTSSVRGTVWPVIGNQSKGERGKDTLYYLIVSPCSQVNKVVSGRTEPDMRNTESPAYNKEESRTTREPTNLVITGLLGSVVSNKSNQLLLPTTTNQNVKNVGSSTSRSELSTSTNKYHNDSTINRSKTGGSGKNNKSSINVGTGKVTGNLEKYGNPNKSGEDNGECFCRICDLDCSSNELLKDHRNENNCICRICAVEFVNHAELERHFVSHLTFKCHICEEVFIGRKDLHSHMEKEHKKPFECEICLKQFYKKKSLRAHKSKFHSDHTDSGITPDSVHKCEVCGKICKRLSEWKYHTSHVHLAYEYMECKYCQKLVLGPVKLKHHVKRLHLNMEHVKAASCHICEKMFKDMTCLIRHQELFHDDFESLCEICGKSIKGKVKMVRHMRYKHPKNGLFICKICNEQFTNGVLRQQHYNRVHMKRSAPTTVFCEVCGKLFKHANSLKTHSFIHSGEKSFKCDVCGATFTQAATLERHSRVHSSVGKYHCDDCGETFKWKQTFDKHLQHCKTDEQPE